MLNDNSVACVLFADVVDDVNDVVDVNDSDDEAWVEGF